MYAFQVILLTTRTKGKSNVFVSDKKRVNVSLTRARKALIIMGNVNYLEIVDNWKDVVHYAKNKDIIINQDDGVTSAARI